MAIQANVFGNTSADTQTYTVASVGAGSVVQATNLSSLRIAVNLERARRGHSMITFAAVVPATTLVYASLLNDVVTALSVAPPALGTFNDRFGHATHASYQNASNATIYFTQAGAASAATVSVGSTITAAAVNALASSMVNAGAVCVCNCNYCTCNCNYCTCDCNYACTCNCNYS